MCDVCAEFLDLLQSYEEKVSKESDDRPFLQKDEVEVVFLYVQSWTQRQCMCCFRDPKNYERFNLITQSIICLAVCQLKELRNDLAKTKTVDKTSEGREVKCSDSSQAESSTGDVSVPVVQNSNGAKGDEKKEDSEKGIQDCDRAGSNVRNTLDKEADERDDDDEDEWNIQEKEKLLHFLSKVFLLNFPLYVAYKHSVQAKLEEISQQEANNLNIFCDLHDPEIPVYLLRNVCLFCKSGGVHAMTFCFDKQNPEILPVSLAHSMIAVVCNLKLWLNFRSIMQLFVPLRSKVLQYMCSLGDKDLRLPGIKTMADFMWSAVKDPLDSPLAFDRDGLDLAFKYFTSSTLTMRLAGIAQINSHINMFNELCNSESIVEVECVGQSLANWLIENNIVSQIFGPNLHVEVIKQSHIILSFLAMECKITNEHIDIIWQAAQLKHCSRQVHDLLPPLIKHLEAGPVLHLYSLLCKLEPRDHTEQSLYLASTLIKFIWTSGGSYSGQLSALGSTADTSFLNLGKTTNVSSLKSHHHEVSSSENSISMEASNSEDEQVCQPLVCVQPNNIQQSQHNLFKSRNENSEGPTPCKQPRKRKKHFVRSFGDLESSDGSAKIEELEDEEEDQNNDETGPKCSSDSVLSSCNHHCNQPLCNVLKDEKGTKHQSGSDHDDADAERSAEEDRGSENLKERRQKRICKRKKAKDDKLLICSRSKQSGCSEEEEDAESGIEEASPVKCSLPSKNSVVDSEPDQEVPNVLVRNGCAEFVQVLEEHSHDSSHDSLPGGVITELASMVQGSETYECRPFSRNNQAQRELMEEMLSAEEGSYSSRMSNKSEKNMADFDGEESGCEDELAQLAAQAQVQAHLSPHNMPQHPGSLSLHARIQRGEVKLPARGTMQVSQICSNFEMENVCKPGSTLLWDLLQDDKIEHLGEGLALEAEKALCNLLCFNTERLIRMKFIEGCLENLANNRSVVVSLRVLPKLFASFQQFRGMDTHQITTWAEEQHNMMECFFENLKVYTLSGSCSNLYSHQLEIQVRLQFLTSIFSPIGSPDNFRLTSSQVDTLWDCLATDNLCADELFSWLLSQAKSKEQHALGIDALKHLYIKKLPSLDPERMSMTGLCLFQQLCSLARLANVHMDSPLKDVDAVGMAHMWKIALKANNTDVSMAAIQYLNSYYVGRQLDHESEFVSQSMAHLAAASAELASAEEASLLCIQRALLLLKTHLEAFRRRYAYHLRRWALEGCGVASHVQLTLGERGCLPIRIVVQPAGVPDKITLELLTGDYIADLRAEVAKWWEQLQAKNETNISNDSTEHGYGPLSADGPIRMITQGQELTAEFDEKTLQEMGFKDLQLVFISVGASRQQKKRGVHDMPSALPPPPRESLPTLLLLQPQYFEQLFLLMHTLSSMRSPVKGGHEIPHIKAQLLSRRVWDILTLLPTSPTLLRGFQTLQTTLEPSLQDLLNPASPQKLMYSLYIVESLGRTKSVKSVKSNKDSEETLDSLEENWNEVFIQRGGLRHLFDIFMSGVLQRSGGNGSEWQQDCLALLLKLLCQLGMVFNGSEMGMEIGDYNVKTKQYRRFQKGVGEKRAVPKLNEAMLHMMDVEQVMPRITSILYEASLPRDPNHYKTGFWGRAQVVHYAMALLVSWVHSKEQVREAVFADPLFSTWLRRLVLEDPEPAVRREVCTALYRLCLGSGGSEQPIGVTAQLLSHLMDYLSVAEGMRPQKIESLHHAIDEGKEPYGPACRDYFWLLCRLVDGLPSSLIKESIEDPQACLIDIDSLAKKLASSILSREYLEMRHNTNDDDGLIGLLNLMCNVLKHEPPFKISKEGQEFLSEVFDFLFALPNPKKRHVPKCKSQLSRSSAFDLLVELAKGSPENYELLHKKLLAQHEPGPNSPYPWDYWPHEDGRSDCGYVGLTNLGATCYMASCMQHLYMMPQARTSILSAKCDDSSKHEMTLRELQRMFAYLLESERKAYNPRSFCKVYTMDHQPLNTGEQKDMAEFFIDLVSKLEEMTPELKKLVKTLFGGVLSNNVVSLDCDHVSRTLEEFYTVRCQVADMRNLYESLDEVTVKDTLEGDNMYTCSHCGKKVRAEKRACFKKLPHILCFNTMRYTFNMVTMLKEKVNTHFSFPLRLDMSGYVEKHLMPQHYQDEKEKSEQNNSETKHRNCKLDGDRVVNKELREECSENKETDKSDEEHVKECFEYDLIGVTVHTGTADGGHYYSFIRDRTTSRDKWFLFNDAEVKPFDPNQIAAECFGGEMTSKTYDSATDKFMDFSFEKTNSAYMLFYEWCSHEKNQQESSGSDHVTETESPIKSCTVELSKELEDWIWQDNMHFLKDKNIFEHTYFNFMWQVCGYLPQTLISKQSNITEMAAQLSTSFFIETFIHAKEKPTMVQWVELLTKQFNSSQAACEWFLDHMANNDWWPVQILIKCPNQMVRQMFLRLCIHVIQRLRQNHCSLYLKCKEDGEVSDDEKLRTTVGLQSCVTRFIRMLLSLMEHGAKAHMKHLTEYFAFLYEFSKMGEEECQFLIQVQAISSIVHFYLGQKSQDYVEVVSEEEDEEEEEEEDIIPLPSDKYKPASLEKMITLVACLVEKSRGPDHMLKLPTSDFSAIAGGKGFPFLYQQIKDCINLNQTRNLIYALCRWNERLAVHIITMLFQAITKHNEVCQPFFKLLTLLTEPVSGPSGLPSFTQLVLQRIWEVAEFCPQNALDWLAVQVPRNKIAHSWVLQSMETWVEHFLLAHSNQRVRSAAAYLLVSLVPSPHFRQGYRTARHLISPHKELVAGSETQLVLHQVYSVLLHLLKLARHYTDIQTHGTMKLTSYFALLTYCVVSRVEKLMFGQYFLDLWQLFHPKLSEPSIPVHHNKQALLLFWHHVCIDCPENVQLILQNAHVTKNIAFNYILADHEDQDVVMFNRSMLPAYYGLLRLCCQQSRTFTRQLASHQNLHWAFKNITPHPTQYSAAVDELFKLIQLFVMKFPDSSDQEIHEVNTFRRQTLQLYLQILDGRSCWATLILAFRTLIENDDDRLFIVYNGGLQMAFEAFQTLHVMYHEATACHVYGDLLELLSLLLDIVKCLRLFRDAKDVQGIKEWVEVLRKLATLLNTYNPPDMRILCIDLLKEMVLLLPQDVIQILVPLLSHCHAAFQENHNALPMGPFFPRRGHKVPSVGMKTSTRPTRPMVQMAVPHGQLESAKGVDDEYDQALMDFYSPYHEFIDVMCRLAINNDCMSESLINLSAMVGFEGVPLHLTYFPKLWLDIYHAQHVDKKYITMLISSNYFIDYIEAVLLDERSSLNIAIIFNFLCAYFPKVASHVLTEQTCNIIDNLVSSLQEIVDLVNIQVQALKLNGDLRALILVYSCDVPLPLPSGLMTSLDTLLAKTRAARSHQERIEPIDVNPCKKRKLAPDEKYDTSEGPDIDVETVETTESKDELKETAPASPNEELRTNTPNVTVTPKTASLTANSSDSVATLEIEVVSTSKCPEQHSSPLQTSQVASGNDFTPDTPLVHNTNKSPKSSTTSACPHSVPPASPTESSPFPLVICSSRDSDDDSPPSASPSSDQTENSGSVSSVAKPSHQPVNWLELLEKTINDLKMIIDKKG